MTTVPVATRLFFYCVAAAAIAGVMMAPKVHASTIYPQAPQAVASIAR